jgi:hypothetical protein
MMAETEHPDELTLLAYVEGEEPQVADHVATCSACAESVRALEAGRAALRASPLLALPAERRARIVAALPARGERRLRLPSLRRTLLVAGPALAVAGVIGLFAAGGQLGGGAEREAGGDAAAEAPAAQEAEEETGGGAGEEGDPQSTTTPLLQVQGPPGEVARVLRERGFEATVVAGAVEVRGADPEDVSVALADRPDGAVAVYVE